MSVDVARRLAFDVLRAVDESDAYANLELARLIRKRGLTGRDAAFAVELAAGTLRMQWPYDVIVGQLSQRELDPAVRDVIRLGCHQLLSMRVPAHAAVATSVSLTRVAIGHRPAGFVNAVLRRVGERTFDGWMDELGMGRAVRTSHPAWIMEALSGALGDEEMPGLLAADNEPPKVTLVARPGLADVGELPGRPLSISPYAVEMEGGDPGAIPAVREGRAGVQDAGSQLMAIGLAAAEVDGAESAWLDLCAGPGGKAALLQAIADQRGVGLVANEVSAHRAALVRSSGVREVVCADGTQPAYRTSAFDRVLVDAPCSGLGALRRRPEARWRRKYDDLGPLTDLQHRLLRTAVGLVRPGGVVGYATCSPVLTETVEQIRSLLAERSDLSLLDAPALLPWVEDARSTQMPEAVQLWPHRHGTDAMFLAILRVGDPASGPE